MQKGVITRLISHKILYNLKKNNANFDEIFNFYIAKYSLSLSDRKLVHNIVLNSMRYNTHINKIHQVNLQAIKQSKSLYSIWKEFRKIRKFGKYDLVIDMQGWIPGDLGG